MLNIKQFLLAIAISSSVAFASGAQQADDATPQVSDTDTTQQNTDQSTSPDATVADEEQPEKVVAVHGDWQIRCRTDNDTCFMYQLAIDAREIPIAEMSIVPLNAEDGRVAGFTVVTPLRTLLTEGVTMQIDNGRQQKYQFGWCTEAGCAARFAVRQDGLDQFKRGNKTRLTVLSVESPDSPVILDISLKGFTAAFKALTEQ